MNPGSDLVDHAAAPAAGFDPARLSRFLDMLRQDIAARKFDGARILMARRGETVLDATLGFADRAAARPLRPDDPFAVMSLVKSWTAVAVLRAVERGDVQLTTRIADIVPGFAANGKQRITLAHILTHTGGMPLGLPPIPLDQMGDLDANMAAICAIAPQSRPGDAVSYSASIGYAILGDVLRKTDRAGRGYRQIMHEDILSPLGMADASIGLRPDLKNRLVRVVVTDDAPNVFPAALLARMNDLAETAEIPGSGGIASGPDMLRFARMLQGRGAIGDVRILSPAMLDLATTIHTGERGNGLYAMMQEENLLDPMPANLGLGFTMRGEGIHLTPFGTLASPRTFGALGIGSMLFWVDPERELSTVMLTAGLLGQYNNYSRFQRWSDMLIAAMVD